MEDLYNMETVTVILNKDEAEVFKMFQQYHELFIILLTQGVFDIQYGKCIMNFAHGEMQNVVKEECVWKKT